MTAIVCEKTRHNPAAPPLAYQQAAHGQKQQRHHADGRQAIAFPKHQGNEAAQQHQAHVQRKHGKRTLPTRAVHLRRRLNVG
jgi:hypothetical protein